MDENYENQYGEIKEKNILRKSVNEIESLLDKIYKWERSEEKNR